MKSLDAANLERFSDGGGKRRHALGAANLRALLKAQFPGVKFSVVSSTFSMGISIDVRYPSSGPEHSEVYEIAQMFSQGDFDGMTDSYNYNGSKFVESFGGAKFVTVRKERE